MVSCPIPGPESNSRTHVFINVIFLISYFLGGIFISVMCRG